MNPLDSQVVPNQVGLGFNRRAAQLPEGLNNRDLAETLIGGPSRSTTREGRRRRARKVVKQAAGTTEYLLPAAAQHALPRDTTLDLRRRHTQPLYRPARHERTILTTAIYSSTSDFCRQVNVWWGRPTQDHGLATLEGGDAMPIGRASVLIGDERAHRARRSASLAATLFKKGARQRVIVAAMPKIAPRCTWTRCFTSPTATACCSRPTPRQDDNVFVPGRAAIPSGVG